MEDRDYQIRQRAYELWEQAGRSAGEHLRFWLIAEKDLQSQGLDKELADSFPASDPPASTMRGGSE